MYLSEAIMLGCKKSEWLRDDFFATLPNGQLASCVLGAAYLGVRGDNFDKSDTVGIGIGTVITAEFPVLRSVGWYERLPEAWSEIFAREYPNVARLQSLDTILYTLNDYGYVPREELARWLAENGE